MLCWKTSTQGLVGGCTISGSFEALSFVKSFYLVLRKVTQVDNSYVRQFFDLEHPLCVCVYFCLAGLGSTYGLFCLILLHIMYYFNVVFWFIKLTHIPETMNLGILFILDY